MPIELKPWRTCRKPKRESMSAPANFPPAVSEGAGPALQNEQQTNIASEAGKRNAHVKIERALQTWTKRQRADSLSEMKHPPKPVNQACERHICRTLFCRLTPELSRPVAGRRTCASVA